MSYIFAYNFKPALTQKEFNASIKYSNILLHNVEKLENRTSVYSNSNPTEMLKSDAKVLFKNLAVTIHKNGADYVENLLNNCKYQIPLRILVLAMDCAAEEEENQLYLLLMKYKEEHYSNSKAQDFSL